MTANGENYLYGLCLPFAISDHLFCIYVILSMMGEAAILMNYWLQFILILLLALPIVVTPLCVSLTKKTHFVLDKLFLHEHQRDDEEDSSFGLYVHIPYCRRRCNYYHFAIVPIGSRNGDQIRNAGFENMDASYKNALLDEIDVIGNYWQVVHQ